MPLIMAFPVTGVNRMAILPAVRRRVERLDEGDVLAAGRGEDIEVAQHRGAVDRDVEDALAGRVPVELGEVEPDRVRAPGVRLGIV